MMTPEFQTSLICSVDDGQSEHGGGGGPASSMDTTASSDPPAETKSDGLNDDALLAIDKRINKVVSTQLRRGFVQDMITEAVKAGISELSPNASNDQTVQEDDNAQSNVTRSNDVDARIAHYEKRLREMENTLEAQQRATEAERVKALRSEERSKLEHELRVAGVPGERLRGAVALLYLEDSRVHRNSDGEILFRVQRDGYVDELPLAEGVREWIKTDEGKIYSPPRDAGGSGSTGGRAPNSKGKPTRSELMENLGQQLLTRG